MVGLDTAIRPHESGKGALIFFCGRRELERVASLAIKYCDTTSTPAVSPTDSVADARLYGLRDLSAARRACSKLLINFTELLYVKNCDIVHACRAGHRSPLT